MQKISFLFSLLGTLALTAQEQEVESGPKLKGVLLVDDAAKIREHSVESISGIQLDGIETPKEELEKELVPFLADLSLTASGVKQLCDAISAHYRDADNLRVSVNAPAQDSSEGVLQLVVTPERLGEVNVQDNQYTRAQSLKKWVRLSTSDLINEKTLAQDVGWMNSNPFRNVQVSYQPSDAPGVTNVDLIVSDKKNWKLSSGVENTGTDPTGPLRVFAGVDINNFIFSDHQLKVKASTANHYAEYQAYQLDYTAPLPWRNTLQISGGYKRSVPDRGPFPHKHKESYQAGVRYAIPYWFGTNAWVDQISFKAGYDFKASDTDVFVDSNPTIPSKNIFAFIGQFIGSVGAKRSREGSKMSADLNVVGSPGQMLPHQTEEDFDNLRPGATATYLYSNLALAIEQRLSQFWQLALKGNTQVSLSTLIPSEQSMLGGASSIRGYAEGAVMGDTAVSGNLELKTTEIPIVGVWLPKVKDALTFLGFVDAGHGWLRTAVPEVPLQQSLLGVGPGVRYAVASYFTGRLDVGFPLIKVAGETSTAPHYHFSAVLSY